MQLCNVTISHANTPYGILGEMVTLKLYIITPMLLPYKPHSSRPYFCRTLYTDRKFKRNKMLMTNPHADWALLRAGDGRAERTRLMPGASALRGHQMQRTPWPERNLGRRRQKGKRRQLPLRLQKGRAQTWDADMGASFSGASTPESPHLTQRRRPWRAASGPPSFLTRPTELLPEVLPCPSQFNFSPTGNGYVSRNDQTSADGLEGASVLREAHPGGTQLPAGIREDGTGHSNPASSLELGSHSRPLGCPSYFISTL